VAAQTFYVQLVTPEKSFMVRSLVIQTGFCLLPDHYFTEFEVYEATFFKADLKSQEAGSPVESRVRDL
jgi:hypothetical protein